LTDIINSNINSLLDNAEDPRKIIRLIIQEMEETLVEVRATAARTIAERKEVDRQLKRFEEAQAEWVRKAEIALRKGREDLSRAALIEKAKLGEAITALREDAEALKSALEKGEVDIEKLETKLRETKVRQKAMETRHDSATNRLRTRQKVYDNRVDDAFTRFEHIERRIDRVEGQVEAYDMGREKTLDEEFAELETDSRIEDELAELKQRMAGEGAKGARD
jgi:phage shock protein A